MGAVSNARLQPSLDAGIRTSAFDLLQTLRIRPKADAGEFEVDLPLELLNNHFKYGRVDRSLELQPDFEAANPANHRFERLQAVNLDPHQFIQIWALHKLRHASLRRNIDDLHPEADVPGAPESNLGCHANSHPLSRPKRPVRGNATI